MVSNSTSTIKSIHLYNLLGELASSKERIEATEITYSTTALDAGIYFVVIETEEGIVTRKLIKN